MISGEKCAAEPPLPPSSEIKPEKGSVTNSQGLKLVTWSWTVPEPKGAVLLVHGYSSWTAWEFLSYPNSSYEGSTVEALNKVGLNVYGYDQQGFGESDCYQDTKGYVNQFSDYVDDAIHMFEKIKKDTGMQNVFVLGQSLGGCVSSHVGIRLGKECSGVILFSPMLSLEANKKKNWLVLPLLNILNYFVPWLEVGEKSDNPYFPEMTEMFRKEELAYKGKLRVRLGCEFLTAVDHARDNAHKLEAPLLVFHSTKDTMCEIDGSHFIHEKASSTEKKLVIFGEEDQFWHAITVEPDNHKAFAHMKTWIGNLLD